MTAIEAKRRANLIEWLGRYQALVVHRGMSPKAAAVVVDAAMFGEGCIEGEVRERIENAKNSK